MAGVTPLTVDCARARQLLPDLLDQRDALPPDDLAFVDGHLAGCPACREAQGSIALYTPRYGLFEIECRAVDDRNDMVALWMVGFGDEPSHSAEICVCEIFGRDVGPTSARVGMGVHPFEDPAITDEFAAEHLPIDAREPHVYSVRWTSRDVAFYVDQALIKIVRQSPRYPMQFMLDIYEFAESPELPSAPDRYPKVFAVDRFRGYRPVTGADARPSAFDR